MPRPIKCRRIEQFSGATYFKPAGIPISDLEEITLSMEELEALRLKEIEGLEQEQGAEKMNISRPTFQRILASARYKAADALLNGKAVRIEGGNFEIAPRRYLCVNGHEWEVTFESAVDDPPQGCPVCQIAAFQPLQTLAKGCARSGKRRCCGRQMNEQSERAKP